MNFSSCLYFRKMINDDLHNEFWEPWLTEFWDPWLKYGSHIWEPWLTEF